MASTFTDRRMFSGPAGAVFEAVAFGLREMGVNVYFYQPATGQIAGHTGLSMASYGEKLEVQVYQSGEVQIVSSCQMAMTVVDWGKNKRNVHLLFGHVERILPQLAIRIPPVPTPPPRFNNPSAGGPVPPPVHASDPMSQLHARYLRGELSLDEFERQQAELMPRDS